MPRGPEAIAPARAHDVHADAAADAATSTLTLAMRAARKTSGPRALRVARVEAGRIVDERLVRAGTEVTIGADPSSTFVLVGAHAHAHAPAVGARATLFAFRQGRWHFAPEPRLRALLALRVSGVSGSGAVVGASCELSRLPDDARGRVTLGDSSFLFQLVEPPARPMSRLPRALLGTLGARLDVRFTTIAAFSFLAHFGAAVAMHGDGLDIYVDDEAETASFINAFRERPAPPEIEVAPPTDATPRTTTTPVVATKPHPRDDAPPTTARTPTRAPTDADPSSSSESRADLLAQRADAIAASMLGSPGGERPATGSTLRPGYVPGSSELDRTTLETGTIDLHAPKLKLGASGDPRVPPSPSLVATPCRYFPEQKAPREERPVAPPPAPTIKPIRPIVLDPVRPPDFDTQIAANKWRFRACYSRALDASPDAGGTVHATVSISAEGTVTSATANGSSLSSLDACIASSLRSIAFRASGQPSVVNLSIVLASAK